MLAGAGVFTVPLYNSRLRQLHPPARFKRLSASADLELMRAAMLLDTDAAAASRTARAILDSEPNHEAAGLLLAAACRRLNDPSGAVEVIEVLVAARPDGALLRLELGSIYAAQGRSSDAVQTLEKATELDSTLRQAWRELSALRLSSGDIVGADTAYMRYRRLASDPPELAAAYAAFDQNHLDAAEALARGRLPGENAVAAWTLLAAIASRRGDDPAEEDSLRRLLQQADCDNSAREQLVRLLLRQGRTEEALRLLGRLLAAEPRGVALRVLEAEALRLAERHTEGLAILNGLKADEPSNPDFWVLAGNQQRYMGRTSEALASYRRAIELRPGFGAAYLALANFKTLRFSADDKHAMQAALASAAPTDPDLKSLLFALAKASEDDGSFEAAFGHYVNANSRVRAEFYYDAGAQAAFVQRFKATFTRGFFAARQGWSASSIEPIFIVGLPRAGSTLLEQILSSHSRVEGTRELAYLPAIARELAGPPQAAAKYPQQLAGLDEANAKALAARYAAAARMHCKQGRPRFIDKMHGNFNSIGLIHLMFPRASIIDARRHPMAWGAACYKQLFNPGMNFAYDLQELGLYYRDYAELMRHVDEVLPGRVHRVHYERMVTDTEKQVRRLLDYCGLPFEPQCLKFHENPRVAQTISSEQVRSPIYAEGVGQWRNFEPWLGPLKLALGDELR